MTENAFKIGDIVYDRNEFPIRRRHKMIIKAVWNNGHVVCDILPHPYLPFEEIQEKIFAACHLTKDKELT